MIKTQNTSEGTMSFLVKSEHTKVHEIRNGRPVCGGGRGGKSVTHWQQDIGPANCKRCQKLLAQRAKRVADAAKEVVSA